MYHFLKQILNLLFFQFVTNILEYQENKLLSFKHKNSTNET